MLGNVIAVVALGLVVLTVVVNFVVRHSRHHEPHGTAVASGIVVVAVDEEKVRREPSGKVIGKVRRGDALAVRSEPQKQTGWLAVTCCGGKNGYIWTKSVRDASADSDVDGQ